MEHPRTRTLRRVGCGATSIGGLVTVVALLASFSAALNACDEDLESLEDALDFRNGCEGSASDLVLAAGAGELDAVTIGLDEGADPDETDDDGYTALRCAAQAGHVDVVDTLLEAGADPDLPQPGSGETALLRAIDERQNHAVRVLLDGGADPNLPARRGDRPLLRAALSGSPAGVVDLLDAGADPNHGGKLSGAQVDERTTSSISIGDLVGTSSDPEAASPADDFDPLTPAARQVLRRSDPDVVPPLIAAIYSRKPLRTVQAMLEAGADPDATAFDLLTPVHTAAAAGDVDALTLLLERGASAEPLVDESMESPAEVAARMAIAETALLRRADPEVREVIGDPLRATRAGHLAVVAAYRLRGLRTSTPTA